MNKFYLLLVGLVLSATTMAQEGLRFIPNFTPDYTSYLEAQYAAAPVDVQVLFSGSVDTVTVLDSDGNPAGFAAAKEGHDFIGITPDGNGYWISVNHETRLKNAAIGDGGGMTTFRVVRNAQGTFDIVSTLLPDGREGRFHNVDFTNTVGETWTNCGGIISPEGRIWTAEEYPSNSPEAITFLSDRSCTKIGEGKVGRTFINDAAQLFEGDTLKTFENQGWMVEIDPKTGKAIRKQYNWGRMSFEGGCIMPDNKTVFLTDDYRGALFTKFVAENEGDFTTGTLYVFKEGDNGAAGSWIEMDNTDLHKMVNLREEAYKTGMTFYLRLEWITEVNGKVYICETGYDSPCKKSEWKAALAQGAFPANHHNVRAAAQGTTTEGDSEYHDYYGRILEFDPSTNEMKVYLEAGGSHDWDQDSCQMIADYPSNHLSNPDGLGKVSFQGKDYLIINEDLNGYSHNRVPYEADMAGFKACEMYLLDMSIANPSISDLVRIGVGPKGAELTGGNGTQDGKTILVDIQHPKSANKFPYNHASTMAITGWDAVSMDVIEVLSESFATANSLGSFTAKSRTGAEGWEYATYGDGCAKMTGYDDAASQDNDDYLVSASIDLVDYQNPALSFTHAAKYYGSSSTSDLNVLVSTNYTDDVAAASWDTLKISNYPTGDDWNFVPAGTISLAKYAGESINVAFVYASTTAGTSTWEVDDIKVEESFSIAVDWAKDSVYQTKVAGLKTQVLFVGGVDTVSVLNKEGQPNGFATAKESHDFIGITPEGDDFWISVNHESRSTDKLIGDGGGMTSFKVVRDADSLKVVKTTLADGRESYFHNVDFAHTVGETWTNCGGIISPDGRIWTAEEYPSSSNASVEGFIRNMSDVKIGTGKIGSKFMNDAEQLFAGEQLKVNEAQGWMVEIDPKTGKAIRKQYNWGRMSFEGGCIMPDNKTVFLTDDYRGALFTKFVADNAGDFTTGKLYVFKEGVNGAAGSWIEMDNTDLDKMINLREEAYKTGMTFYLRLEWITEVGGKVYICETGYDSPCKKTEWKTALAQGAVAANHHNVRATAQGTTTDADSEYHDYYGRVLEFDPATNEMKVFLEGGASTAYPFDAESDSCQAAADYPANHLSNPDGLGKVTINGRNYLIINEDLNGYSRNRVPYEADTAGFKACEMYLLDMTIANPTIDDLARIMVGPKGAELTGGNGTSDGKTILVDIQHPSSSNTAPYNHACTVALHGWNEFASSVETVKESAKDNFIKSIDNPTRTVFFDGTYDVKVFDLNGKMLDARKNAERINLYQLGNGIYIISNNKGESVKVLMN